MPHVYNRLIANQSKVPDIYEFNRHPKKRAYKDQSVAGEMRIGHGLDLGFYVCRLQARRIDSSD